jgi:large subunit ribosomal protein L25
MAATLEAVKRDTRGKNEARRLRVAGKIPAVVYGGADGAVPVSVDPKLLSRILHSETGINSIIGLSLDGAVTQVLVKEFLLDPVQHSLLHADFYRVQMDKRLTVRVSIVLRGESKGVKQQGGLIDFAQREVEIECLPADIPESLEVDVTELMLGDGVRLKEIAVGAKWTPVSEPETLIVHVVAPRVEEVVAEAAATPEPEVIKKGKPDEKDEEKKK